MTGPVFLNGRFVSQPVTGVQRFSAEIVGAIERLMQMDAWPETTLLTPKMGNRTRLATPSSRLQTREVGTRSGHVWEQMELPKAARRGTLISLGNTAPVLAGRRQVVVIHDAGVFDTPYSYSWRFRLWYKGLQHSLAKTGAQIATVSDFSRQRIAKRLGLDPAGITVMYEGADHVLRVPADPTILDRHGLVPGQFALVVGSRAAHKNLSALREVGAMLQKRGMVIAVAGGANKDVFQDASGDGLGERRLGRTTDAELRALYENAACLLFPSRYEGFGLPPVEAMACGCPVVASAGGAVQEICGEDALYFDNDAPVSIVRAVERLLDETGLADTLKARGLARAASLSWDASARRLADVVRRAS
ncbi:glycosyltransferase family 4 protein [Acidisoma cladoniae]|jgi:glycosyltransferase involved in cell wall biosynthesis|uniref:glycosyltransferase family 4 protein n=1 Tax=Acidisoma cladoniae TaxID=3040935 RepID=UPI002550B058|nr:glycosyltransferase family 1 protein [Acidisoma sp. PAMC 29798]